MKIGCKYVLTQGPIIHYVLYFSQFLTPHQKNERFFFNLVWYLFPFFKNVLPTVLTICDKFLLNHFLICQGKLYCSFPVQSKDNLIWALFAECGKNLECTTFLSQFFITLYTLHRFLMYWKDRQTDFAMSYKYRTRAIINLS